MVFSYFQGEMNWGLNRLRMFFRTDFEAHGDAIRSKLRSDVSRKCRDGQAWEGTRDNVAMLGSRAESKTKIRVIFGTSR
jgi:hypothetical protein